MRSDHTTPLLMTSIVTASTAQVATSTLMMIKEIRVVTTVTAMLTITHIVTTTETTCRMH